MAIFQRHFSGGLENILICDLQLNKFLGKKKINIYIQTLQTNKVNSF